MDVPEPSPPILTNGHLRLRRCRHGIMLYNLNDTHLGTMLDLYGEYSEAEADMFRHFLKPGMTAVEVGANIGAHTLALAGIVGPQGRVLAFEPQRIVFQMLCANLAVNGIEHVDAHWAAVGSAPGRITVPRLAGTQRTNFGGLAVGGGQGDEVSLLTLDSLELPACDFLKIDVEGMERDVILGTRQTIRRLRPTISVENDREEKSPALIQLLWDLAYDCYWDIPHYIHVPNFRGNTENAFPTMASFNLVCLPREKKLTIGHLRKVEHARHLAALRGLARLDRRAGDQQPRGTVARAEALRSGDRPVRPGARAGAAVRDHARQPRQQPCGTRSLRGGAGRLRSCARNRAGQCPGPREPGRAAVKGDSAAKAQSSETQLGSPAAGCRSR